MTPRQSPTSGSLRHAREPPYRWTKELMRVLVRPQTGEPSENPVSLLRDQYDQWRASLGREDGCP